MIVNKYFFALDKDDKKNQVHCTPTSLPTEITHSIDDNRQGKHSNLQNLCMYVRQTFEQNAKGNKNIHNTYIMFVS